MEPVEKFGEFVVTRLRDTVIDHADRILAGRRTSSGTLELQTALAGLTAEQRQLVRRCVLAAIDSGLHDFLFALVEAHDFDQGIAVMVDGENVVAQSDGLQGEPYGDRGWFVRFSQHGPHLDPA